MKTHWLTQENIDTDKAPWILGMNRDYFMLAVKTMFLFLGVFLLLTINLLAYQYHYSVIEELTNKRVLRYLLLCLDLFI